MTDKRTQTLTQLANLLIAKGWTISCAESCTGGGLAYAFTSLAGSSAWFAKSWVTYSNQAKQECVGVASDTLSIHGAVSEQTVLEMAAGAQSNAAANIAVSISGIAGPDGGSKEKPVGLVWFGFAYLDTIISVEKRFAGDRSQVREQAIDFALQKLVSCLVDDC